MKVRAGKIIVVVVKHIFFSWCAVPRSLALKHLHWVAALPSAKPPPLPTFISMVTRGRHSAASKLLLLFHHASWHCQGLSVFLQLWMNIKKKRKKKKGWIWMGSFYLGGPTAGKNGQPSSDLVSVRCLVRKKQSCFINWLTWRVGVIRIILLWSECGDFLKQLRGGGERGRWLARLCWRAAGKLACCDLLQILLSHGVFNVFSGIV